MLDFKETNHPYYCEDNNYYNNNQISYDSWKEFKTTWALETLDLDYNYLFRFDIKIDHEERKLYLHLYFIQQRKGNFQPVIVQIKKEDMPEIDTFLLKCKKHLLEHWIEIKEI